MTAYMKEAEVEPDVKELLELSTLYHNLITELAELWGVTLTPTLRLRAFQMIAKMTDDMKMKTLATVVLSEVKTNDVE